VGQLEAELQKLLPQWENETGQPFLVNGSRFLDDLLEQLASEPTSSSAARRVRFCSSSRRHTYVEPGPTGQDTIRWRHQAADDGLFRLEHLHGQRWRQAASISVPPPFAQQATARQSCHTGRFERWRATNIRQAPAARKLGQRASGAREHTGALAQHHQAASQELPTAAELAGLVDRAELAVLWQDGELAVECVGGGGGQGVV
jgi:hypothetical protein